MDGGFRLGALTTWTQIADAELPPQFDALKKRTPINVMIQNSSTVGDLCNASAADGVPPLLALDARVELRSAMGVRTVPLAQSSLAIAVPPVDPTRCFVCRDCAEAAQTPRQPLPRWAPAPAK